MACTLTDGLVVSGLNHCNGDNDALLPPVIRLATARLPTIYGEFDVTAYRDRDGKEHLLVQIGDHRWRAADRPASFRVLDRRCAGLHPLRLSRAASCHLELFRTRAARRADLYATGRPRHRTGEQGSAYALQDQGMDTVEANLHLGFPADGRTYENAAAILHDQGMTAIRILTNNPRKIAGLEAHQIRIVERIPHTVLPGLENKKYLETKAAKLGHLLGL